MEGMEVEATAGRVHESQNLLINDDPMERELEEWWFILIASCNAVRTSGHSSCMPGLKCRTRQADRHNISHPP